MSNRNQASVAQSEARSGQADGDVTNDAQISPSPAVSVFHELQLSDPVSGGVRMLHGDRGRDNVLMGTDENDVISGAEQDDVIFGKAGDDRLLGNGGNDFLFGGEGKDVLIGGDGDDTLDGVAGINLLEGNDGNDHLMGGAHDDSLEGGPGDDVLIGGKGYDSLFGMEGNDIYRIEKGDGHDFINNGAQAIYLPGNDRYFDRVEYGSGIRADQLWFQHVGDDLMVTNIETGDSQQMHRWYKDDNARIDEFHLDDGKVLSASQVDPLVTAMASMPMPAIGSHSLPAAYQAALQPVLAQSWN
jgi:Ca2+-binding RTX toxin-like protein